MFDFGIFCHLLRLMGIYRVGPPSGYLKNFVLSFHFFIFFFICLSFGAPLAPGHLDIVHPCHPVATPLIELWIKHLSDQGVSQPLVPTLRKPLSRKNLLTGLTWLISTIIEIRAEKMCLCFQIIGKNRFRRDHLQRSLARVLYTHNQCFCRHLPQNISYQFNNDAKELTFYIAFCSFMRGLQPRIFPIEIVHRVVAWHVT